MLLTTCYNYFIYVYKYACLVKLKYLQCLVNWTCTRPYFKSIPQPFAIAVRRCAIWPTPHCTSARQCGTSSTGARPPRGRRLSSSQPGGQYTLESVGVVVWPWATSLLHDPAATTSECTCTRCRHVRCAAPQPGAAQGAHPHRLGPMATMRQHWLRDGFIKLGAAEAVGPGLLQLAAEAAADEILRAAREPFESLAMVGAGGVTMPAFPFLGTADASLHQLALHSAIQQTAEQLFQVAPGEVRLIHSSVLRSAGDGGASAGEPVSAEALTLTPLSTFTDDDALVVLILLARGGAEARGQMLFHRLDPLRRFPAAAAAAAAMLASGAPCQQVVLRRAAAPHVQCDSYSQIMGGLGLLPGLTPAQRSLLGFPLPGHAFWTRGTAAAVASRYSMDLAPYSPTAAVAKEEALVAAAERYHFGGHEGRPAVKTKLEHLKNTILPTTWQTPEPALPPSDRTDGGGRVLTEAQVEQWRTQGWVVVDGVWPRSTIAAAARAAEEIYPRQMPELDASNAEPAMSAAPFGNTYPFSRQALNEVVLHPRVLRAAAELLGEPDENDVRFYGDIVLGKYGTGMDSTSSHRLPCLVKHKDCDQVVYGSSSNTDGWGCYFEQSHSQATRTCTLTSRVKDLKKLHTQMFCVPYSWLSSRVQGFPSWHRVLYPASIALVLSFTGLSDNTMLVPPEGASETVNCILNYSDSATEIDGATRFIAEQGLCSLCPEPGATPTRGRPILEDGAEELYARERAVKYTAGASTSAAEAAVERKAPSPSYVSLSLSPPSRAHFSM